MKRLSNAEFAKLVLDRAEQVHEFSPEARYDPDGDCIEFIAEPDDFYSERVDELLTVYYSRESGEIIGSLIKGVSKIYEHLKSQMPGFVVEVIDGRVRVQHLFLAKMWTTNPEKLGQVQVRTYRKLIQMASDSGAEVELCGS